MQEAATLRAVELVTVNTSSSPRPVIRFGVFELCLQSRELRKRGMKIKLQGQPVETLVMLLERPGEIITREELQKRLWPADTFVDFEQGLNNAMKRLRAALGDDAETPRFIETLPRRGYRFVGMVNGGFENGSERTAVPDEKPDAREEPAHHLGMRSGVALVSLLGLIVIAILVGLNMHGWRDWFFTQSPKPPIRAFAVLPLANLSGDPEQEYFADGITEALITELGKISRPRVISRQSVMQYKGSKKSLSEIALELNVDALLEGTVERSRGRVRVTVHLDRVAPESQIWTGQYNRNIREALGLEDEIARAVADEVQIELKPENRPSLAVYRTSNPEAQDQYLQGLYFGSKYTETGMRTAIAHFQAAIEKDRAYAPAYAELSMAYFWLGNPEQGGPSARETMPQAKAAVTKALQLDPSLSRAHLALGLVLLNDAWNWAEAENQYRLALNLNPSCGECHAVYAALLMASGRKDEAVLQTKLAIELDPVSTEYRELLALIAFSSRQYDLAIKQCENLNSQNSATIVGLSYAQKSMYPKAISNLERAIDQSRRQTLNLGYLAQVYGLAGRKNETRKIVAELKEKSLHQYIFPSTFANAYLGLGQKEKALTWLERAYDEKDPWLFYLKIWPPLDSLRSEPRFQALLLRVNLTQ